MAAGPHPLMWSCDLSLAAGCSAVVGPLPFPALQHPCLRQQGPRTASALPPPWAPSPTGAGPGGTADLLATGLPRHRVSQNRAGGTGVLEGSGRRAVRPDHLPAAPGARPGGPTAAPPQLPGQSSGFQLPTRGQPSQPQLGLQRPGARSRSRSLHLRPAGLGRIVSGGLSEKAAQDLPQTRRSPSHSSPPLPRPTHPIVNGDVTHRARAADLFPETVLPSPTKPLGAGEL